MATATRRSKKQPTLYVWKRLVSAKWEEEWMERLGFLNPEHLVVVGLPNAKTLRVEAYHLTKKEADLLTREFGGKLSHYTSPQSLIPPPPERPPILIRDRLAVVSSSKDKTKWKEQIGSRQVLFIPASMAFGTGEHATTATCLRFLTDFAEEFGEQKWSCLDLGTGSGILAIAARVLGAQPVLAGDFDPNAVRVAKENLALNKTPSFPIKRLDVLDWTPERQWDVVVANIYSEILIKAAPTVISAVKPGGRLIFSGILREQKDACLKAFKKHGIRPEKITQKGKWTTGYGTRVA